MKDLTPQRWQQIESILDQALDLPPGQRLPFLSDVCADDPLLLEQVKTALEASGEANPFLEAPTGEHLAAMLQDLPVSQNAGEAERQYVGRYRVIRPIGRGGMAQVYLARRDDEAFKRHVALKIIRRGMDTDDILRRFRTERQILASLNHPHIARLLDGGMTDDGLSYFVMEYIDGIPITKYCDEHRLSVDDRLRLFQHVCNAVHYAHKNLIVHRDLKPTNIMVTHEGEVKLLDFGIAKFLNPDLPGYTVPMTRTEMRVMTPEYASPEQVKGLTITTASDIYSLGVLLYELLAGHRPYQLAGRGQVELARVICETEPDRPSTAISRVENIDGGNTTITPQVISLARNTPTDRLRRRLSGDLDTIVMKALRKEQEHRYQSAEAFLEDIKRHLAGLPVQAQRATVGYRTKKFVQRHRIGVAAVGALVLLLLLVVGLSVRIAVVTQEQSRQIELEAAKAEQVKDFLVDLLEVSNPAIARGAEVTARSLLDRGKERIETELTEQPEVQAELLNVMGVAYRQLGLYEEAQPLLERSLAMRRSLYGNVHPDVAQGMADLAWLLEDTGHYEDSKALYREALAARQQLYGEKHEEIAMTFNDLAIVELETGDYDEAERLFRAALTMQRELLGQEHEDMPDALNNLAVVLTEKGNFDEAEALYREALVMQRKLRGNDHPDVGSSLVNLGSLLYDKGNYDEAETYLRESLALRRRLLGTEHPLVGISLNWLGRTLHKKGQYLEAEALYREGLAIHRKQLGEGHSRVARGAHFLARLLLDTGKYAEAEAIFLQTLATFDKTIPKDHPYVAQSKHDLSLVYLAENRPAEAEGLLRHALEIQTDTFGGTDVRVAEVQQTLGRCLTALARYNEAESLLQASHTVFQDQQKPDAARQTRLALADLYIAWGKPEQAARYRTR